MRVFRLILFWTLLLPLLSACFTTDLTAPPDHSVTIMATDEPAEFRKEYKNYYLFYGILPVWTTSPEEIIAAEGLSEARAQTLDTVSDAVINLLSLLIVFPQTVVVEGNYPTTDNVSASVSE